MYRVIFFLQTEADYKLLKNLMCLLKFVEFLSLCSFCPVLTRDKPSLFHKINIKTFLDEMSVFYFGLLLGCACFPLSLLVSYIPGFNFVLFMLVIKF